VPCGLALDLDGARGARVRVDPAEVEQCLLNLVNNAVHALRGRPGQVRIVAARAEAQARHWVRVSVEDDGPGIAPELQKKVLDPFFTTKPVGEGTGLGLSAVHGIVNAHGGHLAIRSSPGAGTAIDLFFPALPAHAEAPLPTLTHPTLP